MARFLFYDDKIVNILSRNERPSGGAAVQAFGWINGLSELGHHIDILTSAAQPEEIKDECKNLNLIALYDPAKGVRWIRWIYYRFPMMYKSIKKSRPEYLYQGIPTWNSYFLGLICKMLKVKFIIRISNDYLVDDRIYKNYSKSHRYFQKKGFKLAHCILCQNEYQYTVMKKEYPDKKIFKLSNPMLLKFQHDKVDIDTKKYIAWLGLYQYQKNLKLLYETAVALKDEQFLIAGKEESKCDADTKMYLKKLEELPNVSWAGFLERKEVLPFLSKAKYLLNTSHYEGFSNTFLEAMSVGTPIITSAKVNPDNIISDHKLGIVYSSVEDMKQQLASIDPESYKAMRAKVKEYVYEEHDYKLLTGKLIKLLNCN